MKHNESTLNFKREPKFLLHQSIAHYLQRSGFSKALKKFRSEAQIEEDDLEGSSVDLEEICLKYLETCGKDAKLNVNDHTEQVVGMNSENKEEGKSKEKKKKKRKLNSESLANNVEDSQVTSPAADTVNKVKDDVSKDGKVINGAEAEKKSKSKSKRKDKPSSVGDATEQIGNPNGTVSKIENGKPSKKEMIHEDKKDSKKRKRQISEENGQQVEDIKADEETKRRKLEKLNESKKGEQSGKTNGNLESDLNSSEENIVASGQVSGDRLQKTPNDKLNGNDENGGDKSSAQRSQKKQQNGSVEQKSGTVAFQRIQVDKVQFADERLQDNSYWAKSGADKGYGAKAEEILGQVRGRDFRHEKTKKKRGTYRGGQIDLQSHSVKFNYSDDD
ncbi:hypothetical protein RJT34_32819 [Clitoria ternatea]|uniref:LisH domain-containing protein n=1 Tax=Clitoria ternatea TaxID=43366 RepID=A0AAN9F4Q3_CLITE